MPLVKEQREYTYQDYLSWPEDERYEIIDGVVYAQATPTPIHQKISSNLHFAYRSFFTDKECIVFAAPFTVRLPLETRETEEENNKNIVEPDLVVICDKDKIDNSGYAGAPTLIIEIVSKSSIKRDNILKLNKYQKAGVVEYWVVDPANESIMQYSLNEQGHYDEPEGYVLGEDEKINSKVFSDLNITLEDIFQKW